MNGSDDDCFDGHCRNCGAGYFFDVGFSLNTCHACGLSRDHTPDEEAAEAARMANPPDSCETCSDHLDGELFFFDMILNDLNPNDLTADQRSKLTKARALIAQAQEALK